MTLKTCHPWFSHGITKHSRMVLEVELFCNVLFLRCSSALKLKDMALMLRWERLCSSVHVELVSVLCSKWRRLWAWVPLSQAASSAPFVRGILPLSRGPWTTSSSTYEHTAPHTQWHWMSRTRQQALFNLFSSALIGSKLPSLPSWCANECGIEGLPPITPQAHLQDTSGCRAAVCDLYMADEGGARGRKVVSTNLDQSDWGDGKKIPELIIAVEAWRPYMSAPLLMKFTFTVLQYWSFYDI